MQLPDALSAAEKAAKMKHHTEIKVSIGTKASDVEENYGEENVLVEGSEQPSQVGWAETNILAWTCTHDDAMFEGGKLQAVLRGARPHVAVVEHKVKCTRSLDSTSSALSDARSKASLTKSVRCWARKEGYGSTYMVGEGTDAMTVLSVLRPLRVCQGFSISGASVLESSLVAEGKVVLLEYEDWTLVSAVVPKRRIGMGWREYVEVWNTFWMLLGNQVTDFASPTKTLVYAGNLGVALQKCDVHHGLDRVSDVGSITLAAAIKNFGKRVGLVVENPSKNGAPADDYTYYPSAQDKRRRRGARSTYVMSNMRVQASFPKVQNVVTVHHMGGGAHVPVALTLASCPTLVRRRTMSRLRALCQEGVQMKDSASSLAVLDALSEFLQPASCIWVAPHDRTLKQQLHQLGFSTADDNPKDDGYETVSGQRGAGTAIWRSHGSAQEAMHQLLRLRERGGSYVCMLPLEALGSADMLPTLKEKVLCLSTLNQENQFERMVWITAELPIPDMLYMKWRDPMWKPPEQRVATSAAAAAVRQFWGSLYSQEASDCASISTDGEVMPGTIDPTTLLPNWFGPDQEDKEQRCNRDCREASFAVTTAECGLRLGTYVSKFEVKVDETPTIALGDGGADYSIVSEDFALRVFGLEWMAQNVMKPADAPLFKLGDSALAGSAGLLRIPVTVGGIVFTVFCWIFRSAPYDLILGGQFFRENAIDQRWSQERLTWAKDDAWSVPMVGASSSRAAATAVTAVQDNGIYAHEQCWLEPRQFKLTWGFATLSGQLKRGTEGLIKGEWTANGQIPLVAQGLTKLGAEGQTRLLLFNSSEEPVLVYKGMRVGTFEATNHADVLTIAVSKDDPAYLPQLQKVLEDMEQANQRSRRKPQRCIWTPRCERARRLGWTRRGYPNVLS